jgi:hypothetical protein
MSCSCGGKSPSGNGPQVAKPHGERLKATICIPAKSIHVLYLGNNVDGVSK